MFWIRISPSIEQILWRDQLLEEEEEEEEKGGRI